MKASKAQLDRAVAAPAGRLFLLHGADEPGSREIARRIAAALGPETERIELSGAELKNDAARLADEAAAISMFGTARCITVQPAGEECCGAVKALLSAAPRDGNPVVLIAGSLKVNSGLLKLVSGDAAALAFASNLPDARDMARIVTELGRARGLIVDAEAAARIAEAASANRAIAELELDKFAAYLDAKPERPVPLEPATLEAVGAAVGDDDTRALTEAVFAGNLAATERELARLRAEGVEGISLIRAALRKAMNMLRYGGQSGAWRGESLAGAVSRLLSAEEEVKRPGGAGPLAASAELVAIARRAARAR